MTAVASERSTVRASAVDRRRVEGGERPVGERLDGPLDLGVRAGRSR